MILESDIIVEERYIKILKPSRFSVPYGDSHVSSNLFLGSSTVLHMIHMGIRELLDLGI